LYDRAVELPELIQRIETRREEAARPIVVGVSGYGGSGKSTLTRQLVARLPGAVRRRGELPYAEVLIVDLIGLFHPDALPSIDLSIWCDLDLETSAQRGIDRDAGMGRIHDGLWRDVWLPNERDFEDQFAPRTRADVVYPTSN